MNLFHEGINSLVDFICYDALGGKLEILCRQPLSSSSSASNPATLTFKFAPAFVYHICYISDHVMFHDENSNGIKTGCDMSLITTSYVANKCFGSYTSSEYWPMMKRSSDGKKLYWYRSGQYGGGYANSSHTTYYLAIA